MRKNLILPFILVSLAGGFVGWAVARQSNTLVTFIAFLVAVLVAIYYNSVP